MNEKLSSCAKLLGVSLDSINSCPEEIKNEMLAVIELVGADSEENASIARDELNKIWIKAVVEKGISEIAKLTGIDITALSALPYSAKTQLYYEYILDSSDIKAIYSIAQSALSILEIDKVATLINSPVQMLQELPLEVQEQLCGMYAMEISDDEAENSTLAESLTEIVRNAI